MKKIFVIILSAFLFFSCNKNTYNRVLKSSDYELKYKKAMEYFNKKDYTRAMALFEQLLPFDKGKARGEICLYYYSYCNYYLDDYELGGYYFRKFSNTYPISKYTEETMYMGAYCFYLSSPRPSLDQANTKEAITAYESFLNKYPTSSRAPQCNEQLDILRNKLSEKAFKSAKLYYDLGYHKAADISLKNCIADFPDSPFKEKAMFYLLKNSYLYAINSVDQKKIERLNNSAKYYTNFVAAYPKSSFVKEATKINENINTEIANFKKK